MKFNFALMFLASLFLLSFASAGYSWDGQPYDVADDRNMKDLNGLYNVSYWAYYDSYLYSFDVDNPNASEVNLFFGHNKTYSGLWGGRLMFYNFTSDSWYLFPFESFDIAYYLDVFSVGAGLFYEDEPYYLHTTNAGDVIYVCPNSTIPEGADTCLYNGKVGAYADQSYDSINETAFLPDYFGEPYITLNSDFWDENGVMRINFDYIRITNDNEAYMVELLPYTPTTPPEVVVEEIKQGDIEIYGIMESSGAGLGKFMLYMSQSLPVLLLILAMIGVIIAIAWSVARLIINFKMEMRK